MGVQPISASLRIRSGSASASWHGVHAIHGLFRSAAEAQIIATQTMISYLGYPDSAIVGMPGSMGSRREAVTATALTWPLLIKGTARRHGLKAVAQPAHQPVTSRMAPLL